MSYKTIKLIFKSQSKVNSYLNQFEIENIITLYISMKK